MDEFDGVVNNDAEDESEVDEIGTADDDVSSGSEESTSGASDGGEAKRVNDLMSKWQRAEAQNEKLQKRLDALEAKGTTKSDAPNDWVEVVRSTARDQIYGSDPRLKTYGIKPEAIDGNTPAEMRASFEGLKSLVDRIETDASNAALKKAGLTASQTGGTAEKVRDVPDSDEDFEKLVQATKDLA